MYDSFIDQLSGLDLSGLSISANGELQTVEQFHKARTQICQWTNQPPRLSQKNGILKRYYG